MKLTGLAIALLFFASSNLTVQTAPSPPPADKPKTVTLSAGTEINLKTAQDLKSRQEKAGNPVELVLADDLKVGDVLVAKSGARAIGEGIYATKVDFWGNPGEISIRAKFLRVGNTKVEIHGSTGASGTFYVVSGKEGTIKAGTPVKAFVAISIEARATQTVDPAHLNTIDRRRARVGQNSMRAHPPERPH